MLTATAFCETANGSKYLQQICKHFAHKVEVSYDAERGECALPSGRTSLIADDSGLRVKIEATDAAAIIDARFVIDRHLVTFAHREGFCGMAWRLD